MISFRSFLESPAYCGLELSPLMAALSDAADGLRPAFDTAAHFGCACEDLPDAPRRTVVVRAGGRGGKTSRLVAPKAVHAAWTVPLPTLRPGEVASAIIVAPDLKLARQALSFVKGYVEGSRILKRAVVEETKDYLALRRPDGHVVRIEVLAATRGGRAVRGRTLVFAALDEACFFFDEDTGVVNDAEIYRAVLQRIVDGGQCWIVSTPWIAGVGLLESLLAKDFGTHKHALCVVAGTRALNPSWDPTGEIERDLREQDPDAATREIDAIPLAAGTGTFFDGAAIDGAVDREAHMPLVPEPGTIVTVGADFGFRSDSSALVVAHQSAGIVRIAEVVELRPEKGAPLQPSEVVRTFAAVVRRHGSSYVMADGHYRESIVEHLAKENLGLLPAPEGQEGKALAHTRARILLHENRVRLPDDARLLRQLREIIARPTAGGGLSISSPRWRSGGHGDVASAAVLAMYQAAGTVIALPKPAVGSREWVREEEERMREARRKRVHFEQNATPLERMCAAQRGRVDRRWGNWRSG